MLLILTSFKSLFRLHVVGLGGDERQRMRKTNSEGDLFCRGIDRSIYSRGFLGAYCFPLLSRGSARPPRIDLHKRSFPANRKKTEMSQWRDFLMDRDSVLNKIKEEELKLRKQELDHKREKLELEKAKEERQEKERADLYKFIFEMSKKL